MEKRLFLILNNCFKIILTLTFSHSLRARIIGCGPRRKLFQSSSSYFILAAGIIGGLRLFGLFGLVRLVRLVGLVHVVDLLLLRLGRRRRRFRPCSSFCWTRKSCTRSSSSSLRGCRDGNRGRRDAGGRRGRWGRLRPPIWHAQPVDN